MVTDVDLFEPKTVMELYPNRGIIYPKSRLKLRCLYKFTVNHQYEQYTTNANKL